MPEEKNGDSGFKVVDRRSFTSEGNVRDDAKGEDRKAEAPRAAPRVEPPPAQPEQVEDFGEEASNFETLVSYLSTTAMFQMGLIAGPGGKPIPSDMANARRTIDMLEVLQQKTRGNLTPEETQLLEDVLYELRMTFVEMNKRQARKGP